MDQPSAMVSTSIQKVDDLSQLISSRLLAGTHGLFILSNLQNVSKGQPGVMHNVSIPKFEKNVLNLRERKHIFFSRFLRSWPSKYSCDLGHCDPNSRDHTFIELQPHP